MDEIIQKVFEKIDFSSPKVCEKITPNSTDCLSCFQNQFFDGNKVSYDCNQKRYIYIARYFPVHVKEISQGLSLLPPSTISKLLNLQTINILNIGGGPASDSFAIKRFLGNYEACGEINYQLDVNILRVDLEKNWDGVAAYINNRVSNTQMISFDHRKKHCDISDQNIAQISTDSDFNIITISYLISELSNADMKQLAFHINNCASKNISVLILNDRQTYTVRSNIETLYYYINSNKDFERTCNQNSHCEFSFPDNIYQAVKPKLTTNSIRYLKIIKQ